MPTTSLTTAQEAVWTLGAADDTPSPQPASFTATVAPYGTGAYVALVGTNVLHFVTPPSATGSFTVTVSGASQNGTLLPNDVYNFTVTAPPTPQATHFTDGGVTVKGKDITRPADPGVDHVSGNV